MEHLGMKVVEVPSARSKVTDFPYMLIKWQEELKDLDVFIQPFKDSGELKDGIVVKSPQGFAIFTTGKKLKKIA